MAERQDNGRESINKANKDEVSGIGQSAASSGLGENRTKTIS